MNDLQRLIHQLHTMESAREKWISMQSKREEINQNLATLYEEMQELLIAKHSKQEYDNEKADTLLSVIKNKQDFIDAFKKKKVEFDAILDQLEENSDVQTEALRKQIISLILEKHPDEKETYQTIYTDITCSSQLERESKTIKEVLNKLITYLDQITEIRQSVKRKGIFSYIFGPNPNAMISIHLLALKQEIEAALPKIELAAAHTTGGDDLREVYAEMITFLGELKTQAEERWGFKKLDAILSKSTAKVNDLDRYFTTLQNANKEKLEDCENKLNVWIGNFGKV